jgi:hypothetical protein
MTNRVQGGNIKSLCLKRRKQMEFILDNIKDPEMGMLQSFSPLAASFDMEGDIEEEVNIVGITWRILNCNGFGGSGHTQDRPSYMTVARFMNDIQDYLPASIKYNEKKRADRRATKSYKRSTSGKLWSEHSFIESQVDNISEETRVLLDGMCDWLVMMKNKIEDKLTSMFFINGRNHHLEMLKRRYKSEWTEKVEQAIDTTLNGVKKVRIDFGDEDDSQQ